MVKHFMFMIQIYRSQDFESWMFRMFRMFTLRQSGKFRGHVAISHFNLDQGPLQRQSSQMSDFQEAGDAGAQEFQCVLECLRIFGKCCRAGLWELKFMLAFAQHQDPLAQFEALERWSSRHFSAMVTQWFSVVCQRPSKWASFSRKSQRRITFTCTVLQILLPASFWCFQ